MILPGHLSAVSLVPALSGMDRRGLWAACMFPDLIDKPLRWVLHITPNDRLPAHSGSAWLLSTLVIKKLAGSAFARGWALGYGVHLGCDAVNASLNRGRVYWLWPFRRYQYHVGPTGLLSSLRDFQWRSLLIEAALAWLGLVACASRAAGRQVTLEGDEA